MERKPLYSQIETKSEEKRSSTIQEYISWGVLKAKEKYNI